MPEADRKEFVKMPGHRVFEPMPGRPMKEYVEAPGALLEDPKNFSSWIQKAVAYAGSLEAKVKKGARKAKKK